MFKDFAIAAAAAVALAATPAVAQMPPASITQRFHPDFSKFHQGPVFKDFGNIATVDSDMPIPPGTVLKAMFLANMPGKPGKPNRAVDNVARFINMNVAAGLPEKDVQAALVLHGPAVVDALDNAAYAKRHGGTPNASAAMLEALIAHGVRIYVCGQASAAFHVDKKDLLPGIKMALSALDAEVLLQEEGYKPIM